MLDIKSFSFDELIDFILDLGEASYRASQIFRWIYQRGASSFDEMTDLPKTLRETLKTLCYISLLSSEKELDSEDGTKKYVLRLEDGNLIETVLLPDVDHYTLCVSTQVGCAMGCKFCLTGKRGLSRDLKSTEILNQICLVRESLPEGNRISNLVLMGMGEPLANYSNTSKALRIITDPHGLQFSGRKVTVSTAGLVPEIEELGKDTQVNLAISLNASDNDVRDLLMPINRRYPLDMLLNACREFPLPRRRRITFEYILIKGVNDSIRDAERLTKILKGIQCKINLIPFNEHDLCEFSRPDDEAIENFQQVLLDSHFTCIIRAGRGFDILAGCGQLGSSMLTD